MAAMDCSKCAELGILSGLQFSFLLWARQECFISGAYAAFSAGGGGGGGSVLKA